MTRLEYYCNNDDDNDFYDNKSENSDDIFEINYDVNDNNIYLDQFNVQNGGNSNAFENIENPRND